MRASRSSPAPRIGVNQASRHILTHLVNVNVNVNVVVEVVVYGLSCTTTTTTTTTFTSTSTSTSTARSSVNTYAPQTSAGPVTSHSSELPLHSPGGSGSPVSAVIGPSPPYFARSAPVSFRPLAISPSTLAPFVAVRSYVS
jgi:hypothetical protein